MNKGNRYGYPRRVLIAIDQLFNALADGNVDETISARLGYIRSNRPAYLTNILMRIVDITFWPIDGKNHCTQAYVKHQESRFIYGNDAALAALSIFVVAGCILIMPFTYVGGLIKLFR